MKHNHIEKSLNKAKEGSLEKGSKRLEKFFSNKVSPQRQKKIDAYKKAEHEGAQSQLNDPKQKALEVEYAKAGGFNKWRIQHKNK